MLMLPPPRECAKALPRLPQDRLHHAPQADRVPLGPLPLVQGSSGAAAANRREPISPSFKGNHAKGSFTRPSRHRGKQVPERGLSREADLRHDRVNDSERPFLEVTGGSALSGERAMDARGGRIARPARSSRPTGDRLRRRPRRTRMSPRTQPTRTAPGDHPTRSTPSTRSSAPSWSRSGACRRKRLDAYLAWFRCRTFMATDSGAAGRTVARQLAHGVCRGRVRDMFNDGAALKKRTTGPAPACRGGRMVAPRYTRRVRPCRQAPPATTIRIDPEVRGGHGHPGRELGLSMSTAVNAFLRALVRGAGCRSDEGQDAGARRETALLATGRHENSRDQATTRPVSGRIAPCRIQIRQGGDHSLQSQRRRRGGMSILV